MYIVTRTFKKLDTAKDKKHKISANDDGDCADDRVTIRLWPMAKELRLVSTKYPG